jgi:hypothetical protein
MAISISPRIPPPGALPPAFAADHDFVIADSCNQAAERDEVAGLRDDPADRTVEIEAGWVFATRRRGHDPRPARHLERKLNQTPAFALH